MKTIMKKTGFALALTGLLAGAPLMATAAPWGASNGPASMHRVHHAGGPGQGMMAKGLKQLDLTQDQKDQLFAIRHDQAKAVYEQKKALREAARSLRELGQADSFDEAAARKAADALGAAQAELALLRTQSRAQMRAVLTAEQREKLKQRQAHAHKAGKADKGAHRGQRKAPQGKPS